MKRMLFVIGFLLIVGGAAAVWKERAFILESSGPSPTTDMPRGFVEVVSPERSKVMGFASIFVGAGLCVVGWLWKDVDYPDSDAL